MKIYINTMYPLAFRALAIALTLFAGTLIALAVSLHQELMAGETDLIYRYPQMIEIILFPMLIILPTVIVIDLNERKKKS